MIFCTPTNTNMILLISEIEIELLFFFYKKKTKAKTKKTGLRYYSLFQWLSECVNKPQDAERGLLSLDRPVKKILSHQILIY